MAILIKNPETERKARELANLKGETITGAIDAALERALIEVRPRRRPTIEEMIAATERFRREAGIQGPQPEVTQAEWDEINAIPGLAEDEA